MRFALVLLLFSLAAGCSTVRESPAARGEAAKARQRAEANASAWELLFQADSDWASFDPKIRRRGRDAYLRLLREYPFSIPVERHRPMIVARALVESED